MRRAKIVCTIGPASGDAEKLEKLAGAGMNVARLNFSHGSHEEHAEVYRRIRKLGDGIAVMQDLQGPKIRVGEIDGEMHVSQGDVLVLTSGEAAPGRGVIAVDYGKLSKEARPGDNIYLADGVIHIVVERIEGKDLVCRVAHGGTLTSGKGVNLPGISISAPALTDKDRTDLRFGLELGVDMVALSFVRSPEEVRELRKIVKASGSNAAVVVKIEKREALDNISGILAEADAVMIARGDLGVEIPTEDVPIVQKELIGMCRSAGRPVITATQMLESMTSAELPTRAEASDVANAVIDGSDALMLSAETATGMFPVETVRMMGRIIEKAEEYAAGEPPTDAPLSDLVCSEGDIESLTDAVASGAVKTASEVGAKAIAVLTHSGRTARYVSRRRPVVPIVALTDLPSVARKLALSWGVTTLPVDSIETTDAILAVIRDKLSEAGYGGRIVLTAGLPAGERAPTNTVHVVEI